LASLRVCRESENAGSVASSWIQTFDLCGEEKTADHHSFPRALRTDGGGAGRLRRAARAGPGRAVCRLRAAAAEARGICGRGGAARRVTPRRVCDESGAARPDGVPCVKQVRLTGILKQRASVHRDGTRPLRHFLSTPASYDRVECVCRRPCTPSPRPCCRRLAPKRRRVGGAPSVAGAHPAAAEPAQGYAPQDVGCLCCWTHYRVRCKATALAKGRAGEGQVLIRCLVSTRRANSARTTAWRRPCGKRQKSSG